MTAPTNLPPRQLPRIGGSFAPPVDEVKLASFETLATTAPERIALAMKRLLLMLRTFRQTPRSGLPGRPHPSGRGTIVPLEDPEIRRIWDLVPWINAKQREEFGNPGDDDCDQYGVLFDSLPLGDLRNAAYHLLWFARELALDREPITNDTLK
jgi:hypothetical protein